MLPRLILKIPDLVPAGDVVWLLRLKNFTKNRRREFLEGSECGCKRHEYKWEGCRECPWFVMFLCSFTTASVEILLLVALSYLMEDPSKRISEEEIYSQSSWVWSFLLVMTQFRCPQTGSIQAQQSSRHPCTNPRNDLMDTRMLPRQSHCERLQLHASA